MASVSPAEGARDTSSRCAGGAPGGIAPGGPPPPPADDYLPYRLCALCFVKAKRVFVIEKGKVAMALVFRGAQEAHCRWARQGDAREEPEGQGGVDEG